MTTPSSKNATPLNEVILEKAGELFRAQGYAATSIKQIAKAAGCTNAALYYYFEGGKQHILHQVIRHSTQERLHLLTTTEGTETLPELIVHISQILAHASSGMASRLNWLMMEFPTLPEAEQELVQQQLLGFHAMLKNQFDPLVPDAETADRMAWLVFCAFLGYRQIFDTLGVGQIADLSYAEFGHFMAETIGEAEG